MTAAHRLVTTIDGVRRPVQDWDGTVTRHHHRDAARLRPRVADMADLVVGIRTCPAVEVEVIRAAAAAAHDAHEAHTPTVPTLAHARRLDDGDPTAGDADVVQATTAMTAAVVVGAALDAAEVENNLRYVQLTSFFLVYRGSRAREKRARESTREHPSIPNRYPTSTCASSNQFSDIQQYRHEIPIEGGVISAVNGI